MSGIANEIFRDERPSVLSAVVTPIVRVARHAVVLGILLGLWEGIGRLYAIPEYILPSKIAMVLFSQHELLLSDALRTAIEAVSGLILGMSIACLLAVAFVLMPQIGALWLPYVVAWQAIPLLVLAPIFAIWCDTKFITAKVLMAALLTIPPATGIIIRGAMTVAPDAVLLMRSLAASRLQELVKLRIPSAIGHLFSAGKIAASLTTVGAVVAEFSGSTRGLGFRMIISSYRTDTVMLFAAAGCSIALSLALYGAVSATEICVLRVRPFSRPL
jgi:NitT/TauT family transport system permease protein